MVHTHAQASVYGGRYHSVVESSSIHREVIANRPDIIIKNKKDKTCTLIDVAIPADRNVVQNEAQKKLKYESLGIEMQ